MATGRRPLDASGPDIPDLDLAPRAPGAPTRISAAPHQVSQPPGAASKSKGASSAALASAGRSAPAAASAQDYFGSGTFDEDHFGDGGVSIALDSGDAMIPSGGSAPFMGSTVSLGGAGDDDLDLFEGSAANAQAAVSRPPVAVRDTKKWPSGVTPETAALEIDRVEIEVLAAHGPKPQNVFLSPLYAARVIPRRRQLAHRVKELTARFTEAEVERDRLLASLAQEVRGPLSMQDEGARLFNAVAALEKVALERRDNLSGANAEYGRFTDEVKAASGKLDGERAAAETKFREQSAKVEGAERAFQRADAKKKRLYIEVRGIVETAEKAGGQTAPAQAARLAELERLVAEQRPEHEAAHAALEAARVALSRAESEKQQVDRKVRDMERQARTQNESFVKQLGTRSAGVNEVEANRAGALADAARAVLAARGHLVDVPKETLSVIERADAAVVARAQDLEKHVRALDAHDAPSLKAGIGIAAGVVLLVVLAVLLLVLG